ncbi:MAG: hypothetical protein WC584_03490 [Candidatus Pacearchaeota archaeon]
MVKNKYIMENQKSRVLAIISLGLIVLLAFGVLAQTIASTSGEYGQTNGLINKNKNVNNDPQYLGDTEIQAENFVKLVLIPESNVAKDGIAEYKIVLYDLHPQAKCAVGDASNEKCAGNQIYQYKISFKGNEGVNGKIAVAGATETYEGYAVSVDAGQSVSFPLSVATKNAGTSYFYVIVKGQDSSAEVEGKIVVFSNPENNVTTTEPTGIEGIPYGDDGIEVSDVSFFIGKGFFLNADETDGKDLDLKILNKDNSLEGKARIGKNSFRVEGTNTGNSVKLHFFDVDSNQEVYSFAGKILKFGDFTLLKGNLQNSNGQNVGTLTATSNQGDDIKNIVVPKYEEVKEKTAINEVISINEEITGKTESSDEVYVKAVKIEDEKFLYIFPTGNKILYVESVKGDKVSTTKIKENHEVEIEGYNVKVGSLEDDKNIEFSITKTE